MNNREIPHKWAHETLSSGNGSNLFFDGDTIFSYGRHFPIARHVTNKAGQEAILFTTAEGSMKTARHKSMVRQAIPPGIPVFYVQEPERDLTSLDLKWFTGRAVGFVAESRKPRLRAATRAQHIASAQDHIQQASDIAAFFGLKDDALSDVFQLADELQAEIEAEKVKAARRAKREQKKDIAEAQEKIKSQMRHENMIEEFRNPHAEAVEILNKEGRYVVIYRPPGSSCVITLDNAGLGFTLEEATGMVITLKSNGRL